MIDKKEFIKLVENRVNETRLRKTIIAINIIKLNKVGLFVFMPHPLFPFPGLHGDNGQT